MATRRTGQVVKVGDKKWLVRLPTSPGPDGQRRLVSKTIEGTKRDAERYLRERRIGESRGVSHHMAN